MYGGTCIHRHAIVRIHREEGRRAPQRRINFSDDVKKKVKRPRSSTDDALVINQSSHSIVCLSSRPSKSTRTLLGFILLAEVVLVVVRN